MKAFYYILKIIFIFMTVLVVASCSNKNDDVDCNQTPEHPSCRLPDSLHVSTTTPSIYLGQSWADVSLSIEVQDILGRSLPAYLDKIVIDLSEVSFDERGTYPVTLSLPIEGGQALTTTVTLEIKRTPFVPITAEDDLDDGMIYYIHRNDLPRQYAFVTSVRAIQGIVNRHRPNLMLFESNNPYYQHTDSMWKSILEDEGYTFIRLTSYLDVVKTFEHYFEDIIAMDDRIKSYNQWVSADADFAAMLAGITHYLPVPHGVTTQIESHTQLRVVESFTLADITIDGHLPTFFARHSLNTPLDVYTYVFDNFRTLFNTRAYMSLTSEAMDYAVSNQMMFFDLKPTTVAEDMVLFSAINAYFRDHNDYYSLYGWVDNEPRGLQFLSSHGGIIRVVGTGNLSLYAAVDATDAPFVQKSSFVSSYAEDRKYVTFIASEGDTLKAPTTFQQGAWLDPYRGLVPINWGLIGNTPELFPFVARYLYDSMTPNDYFFSGGASSLGFVDIDRQMPEEAVTAIAARNREILALSDQQFVDTYNDLFVFGDVFDPDHYGAYLIESGYTGAFGIHPWAQTGPAMMGDMLIYNRRSNFYPRNAFSPHVALSAMTRLNNNTYQQTTVSDYWYVMADLTRRTGGQVHLDLFTQPNGDGYRLEIAGGSLSLYLNVNGETTLKAIHFASTIGVHDLRVTIDRSSPLDSQTHIVVYLNKQRIINVHDDTFESGGFRLYAEEGVTDVWQNLQGRHFSQAYDIYQRIISSNLDFICAYYGPVFAPDFTESQYRVEPGPGEVMSLSPRDFYAVHLLLEASHPGVYHIVNMHEFYTYMAQRVGE